MPEVSSPIQTKQPYISPTATGDVSKIAKITLTFATFADYLAAVVIAQSNATSVGIPTWEEGQEILNAEEFGIRRTWSAVSYHARTATLRPGLTKVLASDANRFWFVTGTPGVGIGSDGDYGIDWSANALWLRSAGVWAPAGPLYPAGSSTNGPSTAAGLTDIATVSLPTVNIPLSTALGLKVAMSQIGAAGGIASLGSDSKVLLAQLPASSTTIAAAADVATAALPTINAPLATALAAKTTVAQAAAAAPVQSVAGLAGSPTAAQTKAALGLVLADIPGAVNAAGAATAAPVQSVAGLTGAPSAAQIKAALNLSPSDVASTQIAYATTIPFSGSFYMPLTTLSANTVLTANTVAAIVGGGGQLDVKTAGYTLTFSGMVPVAQSVSTVVGGSVLNSIVFNKTPSQFTYAVTQPG